MPNNPQKKPFFLDAPMGLIAGATYPFRGLLIFFSHPNLIAYLIFPLLINIIVGIGLYVGLLFPGINIINGIFADFDLRFDALIARLPAWLSFLGVLDNILGFLVQIILIGLLLLIIGFLLVQFGVILGAPFYGQLSEQLEKLKTGQLPEPPQGMFAMLVDIWRAILFEVKKLALLAAIGLPLLLLNFIPGGSLIATIGGLILAATIVCLDFLDGPLERRRLRFRDKLKVVRNSMPASVSFALVCQTLITVPLLNFLAIPVCVAAGTLFFCDRVLPVFPDLLNSTSGE
jgi:CysZ protein